MRDYRTKQGLKIGLPVAALVTIIFVGYNMTKHQGGLTLIVFAVLLFCIALGVTVLIERRRND